MADEQPVPPPAPAPDAPAPPRRKVLPTPEEELVAKAAGVRWPMAKDTLDPMNLPYHEAGHTLVGLALGRRLRYVSIEPGDQMSDFATNLPGVEELGYVGEVAKEVERLLTVHEDALHELAKALFDKKRLTGDEVTKLVTVAENP